jgi:hypothetical protein
VASRSRGYGRLEVKRGDRVTIALSGDYWTVSGCVVSWAIGYSQGEAAQIFSLRRSTRQEAVAFFPDHRITLATQLFQLGAVKYCDVPTGVADNSELV